ncbi:MULTISPECIES: hypothetical protein [unclassified Methanoculleus]|uniref:hypothetical protein n=1 Tax=unclassified Methanoculleus TaxID=2619537 RepID=UPI0025FADC82|nr:MULTISPECIES: hypothetical protein [unclassified Methanoculleus]
MVAGIAWNDPSSAVLTDAEVPVETESDLSSEIDLNGCVGLFGVGVTMTYNASATVAAVLRVYAKIDGTNYSDEPVYERTMALRDAGLAHQQYFPFPIPAQCVKVAVYNGDNTYTITSLTAYAHKNVLSTS